MMPLRTIMGLAGPLPGSKERRYRGLPRVCPGSERVESVIGERLIEHRGGAMPRVLGRLYRSQRMACARARGSPRIRPRRQPVEQQ